MVHSYAATDALTHEDGDAVAVTDAANDAKPHRLTVSDAQQHAIDFENAEPHAIALADADVVGMRAPAFVAALRPVVFRVGSQ